MSTAPGSQNEGSEEAANKSYIKHFTFDGTSDSTVSAEVCSYQSEWQTKEEQIKVLEEKATEAEQEPWLWRVVEPDARYANENGQREQELQTTPQVKQVWVKNDETIHPLRGGGLT
jgi:hypothetical protein